MPLNLNDTATATNGTLYFQDSDGWKVLGTIKNAEMKVNFIPEEEQLMVESISEDYLRRFE